MISYEGMEYRVIEYLKHVRRLYDDIDACTTRIDKLKNQISLTSQTISDMPSAHNSYGDAIPDGIIKLEEHRIELLEAVEVSQFETTQAWQLCRPVESDNRHLLWLHYVERKHWKDIARVKHYSIQRIYEKRALGIVELYEIMPEEWRRDDAHKAQEQSKTEFYAC